MYPVLMCIGNHIVWVGREFKLLQKTSGAVSWQKIPGQSIKIIKGGRGVGRERNKKKEVKNKVSIHKEKM